jgi:thioredoxin-like negative regulator of GroEL
MQYSLRRLAIEFRETATIGRVNDSLDPDLRKLFSVRRIPATLLLVRGSVIDMRIGPIRLPDLREWITPYSQHGATYHAGSRPANYSLFD